MVRGIKFNDKRFSTKDDNNIFSQLTKNTIIICRNPEMKYYLAEEILDTINGRVTHNDCDCDIEDIGSARQDICCILQNTIIIGDQTITLCLEPAMVYKAKAIEDIWFFDRDSDGETLIPMELISGAIKVWQNGLDGVYKMVAQGAYGGYTGEWISVDEDK